MSPKRKKSTKVKCNSCSKKFERSEVHIGSYGTLCFKCYNKVALRAEYVRNHPNSKRAIQERMDTLRKEIVDHPEQVTGVPTYTPEPTEELQLELKPLQPPHTHMGKPILP